MRCYFLNDGHVAGVEILPPGLSDKHAIARAHLLSLKRKDSFDGFEIWHRSRCVVSLSLSAKTLATDQPRHETRQVPYELAFASPRITSL
jgi:hypothetical protein